MIVLYSRDNEGVGMACNKYQKPASNFPHNIVNIYLLNAAQIIDCSIRLF